MLGARLRRVPDGETGERTNWIGWQFPVLAGHPFFETVPPDPDAYPALPRVRLRPGVSPQEIAIGPLGYAEAAIRSYAEFARLKREGTLPQGYRFQVSLPTPLAPVHVFVMPESQAAVEPLYEARLLAEMDEIAAAIPHHELAIQWDVAVEMAIWEGLWPAYFEDAHAGIIERLVRIGERVPEDVDLGYHLCYGDWEHHHFIEPTDAGNLVEVANALSARVRRPIRWIHMPVPRARADDAYFAPLQGLELQPGTELYLGLVHASDGVEGAQERIEAARRFVPEFGVATECGLGRRPPGQIPALLEIHAVVSAPFDQG